MFEWKVEELSLLGDKNPIYLGKVKTYSIERTVSREDKLAFIDSAMDNKPSYLLALIKKYNEEKDTLSKTRYGSVKTVSLIAWLKRNDPRHLIDANCTYGSIKFAGETRYIQDSLHSSYDVYDDFVDEIFHRNLVALEEEEKAWIENHDENNILKSRVREYIEHYGDLGIHLAYGTRELSIVSDTGDARPLTAEELKTLCEKYEQIESFVEKTASEINIKY